SRPIEGLGDFFQKPAGPRIGLDEGVGERRLVEATARHRRFASSECRRESRVQGFCKRLPVLFATPALKAQFIASNSPGIQRRPTSKPSQDRSNFERPSSRWSETRGMPIK